MKEPDNISQPELATSQNQRHVQDSLMEAIRTASQANDLALLVKTVSPLHPADMAECLSALSSEERKVVVKQLGNALKPELLLELAPDLKEEVIEALGAHESASALTKLDTDEAVSIIEDLEKEDQQEILEVIPSEIRAELEEGLAYADETAGRLMQKRFVAVPEFWTVGQVIDFLRSDQADIPDDFYEIFVVDPKYHPVGTVLVSRVIRQQRHVVVRDIMNTTLRLIDTATDQEEVAYLFHKYGLASAPVVNTSGRLVGLISVDDVVEIIGEEAEEDILHMGGVSDTDINTAVAMTAWRRFPWLLVNIITAISVSMVIGLFEKTIGSIVALAVLMPIIASISGNAGTQTATVTVRALATKELNASNSLRLIWKEICVGGVNSITLGILTAVTVWLRYQNIHLSFVFAMAMFFAMVLGSLAGALIPRALARLNVDPAVATGVFLTGVTDMVSFSSFLALAALFLL